MRFLIYGAGAVGGVVGARLWEHGHDVVLIARGEHHHAIASSGLRLESPNEAKTLHIPAIDHPGEIELDPSDVVLLTVKSQDTAEALRSLASSAPGDVSVVCVQIGVANERAALRLFANVYGVCVIMPVTFLRPGAVQADSAPTTGLLDIGRYPNGKDETARLVAEAFNGSTFNANAIDDIMRWKYAKLLMNLGNAPEALCGPSALVDEIDALARREAEACLRTAGIDFASPKEDRARRADFLRVLPVEGQTRGGGSSWQSLARGVRSIETDYLNGEIVLLGRLHGVPTPVNELLRRLATRAARQGQAPGAVPAEELLRTVRSVAQTS